jgi:hypothetical protein
MGGGAYVGVGELCMGDEAEPPLGGGGFVGMLDPVVMVVEALDVFDSPTFSPRKIQNSLMVEFQKQYHGWSPILR